MVFAIGNMFINVKPTRVTNQKKIQFNIEVILCYTIISSLLSLTLKLSYAIQSLSSLLRLTLKLSYAIQSLLIVTFNIEVILCYTIIFIIVKFNIEVILCYTIIVLIVIEQELAKLVH